MRLSLNLNLSFSFSFSFTRLVLLFSLGIVLVAAAPNSGSGSGSKYPCYSSAACRQVYRQTHAKCAGRFCGRPLSTDGSEVWSDKCMACQIGSRTDGWCCVKCTDQLIAYDALYLIFLFCGILSVQAALIDTPTARMQLESASASVLKAIARGKAALQVCALVEQGLAALCSFLVMPPRGQLSVLACPKDGDIGEWYSGFYNPVGFACASEAILPLYTGPLIYGGFCIFFCVLLRLPLSTLLKRRWSFPFGSFSIYGNLIGTPLLLLFHAILGGTLYFAFGYIVLFFCLLSMTYVMVVFGHKILSFGRGYSNPRPMLALIGFYLYCAFAIVSIMEYYQQPRAWWYWTLAFSLPLVPPTFLVGTWKYTEPRRMLGPSLHH